MIVVASQCDNQKQFMDAMEVPTGTLPVIQMSYELVKEEMGRELPEAMDKFFDLVAREGTDEAAILDETLDVLAEVADAIVDSVYVLYQLSNALELPYDALFYEVHRSNMSKRTQLPDGSFKVIKREDGKVLKPESFSKPNLRGIIAAAVLRKAGLTPEDLAGTSP